MLRYYLHVLLRYNFNFHQRRLLTCCDIFKLLFSQSQKLQKLHFLLIQVDKETRETQETSQLVCLVHWSQPRRWKY